MAQSIPWLQFNMMKRIHEDNFMSAWCLNYANEVWDASLHNDCCIWVLKLIVQFESTKGMRCGVA
ncbi:hypothetical protein IHE45_16G076800 [Dioscorea alata]|uniref:Uncharacterized protein n=1 Tax=Dioscorea alata TaxID=55571 RepID=A0ACB7UIM5_DIOAL|nr:hypothetical protein IHE45_16G076800 [Dioscorea alata]